MYIETTLPLETNNQGEIEVLIVADYQQAQAAFTDCYGRATEMDSGEQVNIDYVLFAGIEWQDMKVLYTAFNENYDYDLFIEMIEDAVLESAHEEIAKTSEMEAVRAEM